MDFSNVKHEPPNHTFIEMHKLFKYNLHLHEQKLCRTMALLKNILRKKKNYGNSNISPCKNIVLKNS